LSGLGITAIWLMPFQKSPGKDDGYDICDYYNINPAFGSLGDFVEFTRGAAQRGIRVIIDLVVNHTSNEHPWFQEARRDPNSQYRDWYVWSKKRPAGSNKGMVSGRAEIHLDARSGGEAMVFPPLLQFPARSQHVQPRCAGRDSQDHGLLDSAWRVRLPHGCRSLRDRHQGSKRQQAG